MTKVKVEFNNINKAIEAVAASKEKALTAAALIVEGDATLLSPVETGYLKGSISHEVVSEQEVRIGSSVEYAPHVEYGTSKMAAQPFLRPAFDKNKDGVEQLIGEHFKKALDEVTR